MPPRRVLSEGCLRLTLATRNRLFQILRAWRWCSVGQGLGNVGCSYLTVSREDRRRGKSVALARPCFFHPEGRPVRSPPPGGEIWIQGGGPRQDNRRDGLRTLTSPSAFRPATSCGAVLQETFPTGDFFLSPLPSSASFPGLSSPWPTSLLWKLAQRRREKERRAEVFGLCVLTVG